MSATHVIQELLLGLESDYQDAELSRIAADPQKHKLTTLMPSGSRLSYRYYPAGKDGKGRTVRFCWSTERNAAGFYLGWREVISKSGKGKRDMWAARRIKRRLAELAQRRAAAFRDRRDHNKDSLPLATGAG